MPIQSDKEVPGGAKATLSVLDCACFNARQAARAITEAAQSRLSTIHASREDLADKAAFTDSERMTSAYAHFDNVICGGDWYFSKDHSRDSLSEDYAELLAALWASGLQRIYRVDLTRPPFDIPVVKVIAPGLQYDHRMV